jgi:predicted PurR-regulated permease PerM
MSNQSPLTDIWFKLAFFYILGGIIAAIFFHWLILVPIAISLVIMMVCFNAVDLKSQKGSHKSKRCKSR